MNFLYQFTQKQLLFVFLFGGVALFMYFKAPYTACDAEWGNFSEEQKRFLHPGKRTKKHKFKRRAEYEVFKKPCYEDPSTGTCAQLFRSLKDFTYSLRKVSPSCYERVGSQKQVRKVFEETLSFWIKEAWGEEPPQSVYVKNAWFDTFSLSVYCSLRKKYKDIYGKKRWQIFSGKILAKLPEASKMPPNKIRALSLVTATCR